MREFIVFIPALIFYLSFKTTVLPGWPLPDLAVMMVFYSAYKRPSLKGPLLAFFLGYIEDVFYGSIVGTRSFALVAVYAIVYISTLRFHFDTPYIKAAGGAVLSLIKGLLSWLVLNSVGTPPPFLGFIVPIAATTGILAPAIISLFERLPLRSRHERDLRDSL